MQAEIEAKFLDVDHDALRERLKELGATCEQPMRLMRRVTIETPGLIEKSSYVRVRDEGNRVTMACKQFDGPGIDGAKEIEIIVDDFEKAVKLLSVAGMPYTSFQESKRESWRLGTAEVVLDEWPWLAPYIEIEASDEATVKAAATQLGFGWDKAVFGDVMVAYRKQYPHLTETDALNRITEVKFDDPLPDMLKT